MRQATTQQSRWRDIAAPAVCALLVFAGFFKGSPLFAWLPFDLTVAAAALVVIAVIAAIAAKGLDLRIAPWSIAILAAFVPGWHAFDPSNPYQVQKLFGMGITLIAIAGAAYLITTPRRQTVWAGVLISAAAVYALSTILFPGDTTTVGGLTIEGSNTIAAGQATGMGVVVSVVFAMTGPARLRYLGILGAVAFAVGVVASGSRGPFLAAIISVIVVALVLGHGRLWRVYLLAVGAAAGWLYLSNASNPGAARILNSLLGQIDATSTRDPLWAAAIQRIEQDPFSLSGVGWGNFGQVLGAGSMSPDMRYYPHNVLLEVWTEAGILAMIATVAFIVASLWRLSRGASTTTGAILFGIAMFAVANAMVSGDVNDNRLMWVSLVIGWAVPLPKKVNGAQTVDAAPRSDTGSGGSSAPSAPSVTQAISPS